MELMKSSLYSVDIMKSLRNRLLVWKRSPTPRISTTGFRSPKRPIMFL